MNGGQIELSPSEQLIPELCKNKSVLWLILFSEALVLILMLLSSDVLAFEWSSFATLSFYVQWVVLITAACLCSVRTHLTALSLNQVLLASFIIIMVVNLIISLASLYGLNYFLTHNLNWQWILRNQLVSAVIGLLLIHYFYAQLQWRLQSRSELQSRMQALQSRIRPHFLFNSMNIIASLIHEDPNKAEQAVEDLSELFRASLKEAGSQVSLEQELELCKKYVHIEQLRLGSRLKVEWELGPNLNASIPMLTIQPLIENAILHGIQPSANGGVVTVRVEIKERKVHINVRNPNPTNVLNSRQEKGNHMALENIRHRLAALYDDNVEMTSGTEKEDYVSRIQYAQPVSES